MKWEMEVLSPLSYVRKTNWRVADDRNTKWTVAENKLFENALAVYDKDTPDRWHSVAATIPGKTVADVIKHYKELEIDISNIEAGLVPLPGYDTNSPFTLEWVDTQEYDGFKQSYGLSAKRSSSGRPADQERKKGVPWTEEEHKLFLLGLKKYGKGDWRNISRNFVITRTPTQVASHAQKYFIRQLSGGKDKRRASIHDITTVHLNDAKLPYDPSQDSKTMSSSQQHPLMFTQQRAHTHWNQTTAGITMPLKSTQQNLVMSPYGADSCELKMLEHVLDRGAGDESYKGSQDQNLVYPISFGVESGINSKLHYS